MGGIWEGTRCVVLDPYDFLARVCAMVPPPRIKNDEVITVDLDVAEVKPDK